MLPRYYALIIALLLCFLGFISLASENLLLACFLVFSGLICEIVFFILLIRDKIKNTGVIQWNKDYTEVKISARNSYVSSRINICENRASHFNYIAPKAVYTGMSIGNVSVGEVNMTKESFTSSSYGTNTYYLVATGSSKAIKSILLSDELAKQAKNDSRVSKYLYGNTLHVYRSSTSLDTQGLLSVANKMASGTLNEQVNAMNRFSIANRDGISYDECKNIKSWLKGE